MGGKKIFISLNMINSVSTALGVNSSPTPCFYSTKLIFDSVSVFHLGFVGMF